MVSFRYHFASKTPSVKGENTSTDGTQWEPIEEYRGTIGERGQPAVEPAVRGLVMSDHNTP